MQIRSGRIKNKYDYIIVGAGIIGITILSELLKKGKKNILIIESGSMLSNNPYPSNKEVNSKKFKIKTKSQFSGVGGGSNVWGSLNGIFDKKLVEKDFNLKRLGLKILINNFLINSNKLISLEQGLFHFNKSKMINFYVNTLKNLIKKIIKKY